MTRGSSRTSEPVLLSDADRLTLRLAREPHTSQTAAGPAAITLHDALLRKEAQVALRGSPLALRNALDRIERATAADAAWIADDCAFWSAYRDQHRNALDRALAARQPTEDILPHPDDIEIDPGASAFWAQSMPQNARR